MADMTPNKPHRLSPGEYVRNHFQDDFAEFVKARGPGHTLQWVEQQLWPSLAHVVNSACRAQHLAEDAQARQKKLL